MYLFDIITTRAMDNELLDITNEKKSMIDIYFSMYLNDLNISIFKGVLCLLLSSINTCNLGRNALSLLPMRRQNIKIITMWIQRS